MVFYRTFGAFLLAFGVCLFGPIVAAQTPPEEKPASAEEEPIRFVLTRLGIVQKGIPVDRGDSILLRLPNTQGGINISKLDILMISSSRQEIFDFQRKQLPAGDIGAYIKLADWSVRNQLAPNAIEMLKEILAQTSDPAANETLSEKIRQMEYVEQIKSEALEKMAASQNSAQETAPVAPEQKRLTAFGRRIPYAVSDRFVRKVQPVLLRRCAVADCHEDGNSDSAFLLCVPSETESVKTGSLRNMETVFDWVRFDKTSASPLLNHPPVCDKNGERIYPFGDDSASLGDYKILADWLGVIEGKMTDYRPDPNRPAHHRPTRTVRLAEPDRPNVAATNELDQTDDLQKDLSGELSPERPNPNSDAEALKRAGYLPKQPLSDEFDPLPFNQKYHPERLP